MIKVKVQISKLWHNMTEVEKPLKKFQQLNSNLYKTELQIINAEKITSETCVSLELFV